MRIRPFIFAILIGFLAFFAYRALVAPGVLPGDAGEFQFSLPLAGVSHPTGYPLYHLLGFLWSRLFSTNPALGANTFSAFWGGVAVAMFYLMASVALRHLLEHLKWRSGWSDWLALLATVLFAANPTFLAQNLRAEVYALHAALLSALLAAALALDGADRRRPRTWLVALLLGLALTHHLTAILILPALIAYLIWVQPEAVSFRGLWRLAPYLLVPLILYLYIPLRAPASAWLTLQLNAGETLPLFDNSVMGVIRFILGTGFAPSLHGPAAALAQLPGALDLFLSHFTWIGIALMILGVIALILEEQFATLILTGLSFLALLIFNLFYGIGDIYTFYIPNYVIATLWLIMGVAYLIDLITRITSRRLQPLLLLGSVLLLGISYWDLRDFDFMATQRQSAETARRWQTIEQTLKAMDASDTILVSNDRDEMTPLVYRQQIEGRLTGTTGLFPLIHPSPAWSDLHATLTSALATGREVHTIKQMPGLEALYETQSKENAIVQVLALHTAPDPSFELPYGDVLRWLNLDWWGDAVPGGEITVQIYWRVTQTPQVGYHSFLQIYNEAGEKVKQADDHRPGGDFLPATLWRPGDIVIDTFVLPLPDDLPPGGYSLVAGFYDPVTGERMADPLPVATLISPSSRPPR